ncbi:hypothetical protein FHX42_001707 [Saccharopolyspora lacisalsi]|uniref:Uncharacterized protein n=1 Tax=Halosaccharopolyspora lacisalsi TaxID=1000566 RepID=A0A839DTW0_9PSEU|nr:hypothetical protein [Halosaccharopolyspora lacisalsi]MBA8824360.1 hypothetical protein [Halosaccharopolyspora lacisalsi]
MEQQETADLMGFVRRMDPDHPRIDPDYVDSWQLLLEPVDHDTARAAALYHYRHNRSPLHPSDVYEFWEQQHGATEAAPRKSARNPAAEEKPAEPPATLSWLMNASETPTVTYRDIRLYPAEDGGWEWIVSDHAGQQLARHRTDSHHHGMWAWGVEVGSGRRWKPVEEPGNFALSDELDKAADELHERYTARGYRPQVTISDVPAVQGRG